MRANSNVVSYKKAFGLSSKKCIHLPINISQCSSDRTNAHVLIYVLKSIPGIHFDSNTFFFEVYQTDVSTFFPMSLNSTGKNALQHMPSKLMQF